LGCQDVKKINGMLLLPNPPTRIVMKPASKFSLLVFAPVLFLASWFGFTILTSVGASDKPVHIFLSWTALFAAALTLLAQAFVLPWLYAVSRILRRVQAKETMDTTPPDNAVLEQE
jgi:NAD/NADP transhydrogenase beta subunit